MTCTALLGVLLLQYVGAALGVDPLVDSRAGLIRGLRANDGDYSMFLGIPYAKVDAGNPFGPSVPYPKFEDTFEAFDDSAICPQLDEFYDTLIETIDCLNLNVYVPTAATSNNRLPVLVWIYGGGFESGFSARFMFGPKFLVRHGIILVTLNYRVGAYGFMCLDTPTAPGNQGLKDQVLALRWVKDNIEAFGGNTNKITIFGESAGSASVDFHLHSAEEGLFHQAILQSGHIVAPWVIMNPRNEGPLKLAEHLGFSTSNVNEAISFLTTVDVSLVMASTKELGLVFRPCVEDNFDDVDRFLADHPVNLQAPKVKSIPILVGFNNDEGLYFFTRFDEDEFSEQAVVGRTLAESFDFDSKNLEEMWEVLKHFYFGDKDVGAETRRQSMDLYSDFRFVHATQRSLRKYYDSGAKSIFSYVFSYNGERNFIKHNDGIKFGGAAHADELSYLFDISYLRTVMPEEDQLVVDRMTKLWSNFVKYGDPTPETTDLLPVNWLPTTKDHWNYLNIDSNLTMDARPFHDRLAFLDLFHKINEEYQLGYHKTDD